jgi:hypothetical protein
MLLSSLSEEESESLLKFLLGISDSKCFEIYMPSVGYIKFKNNASTTTDEYFILSIYLKYYYNIY